MLFFRNDVFLSAKVLLDFFFFNRFSPILCRVFPICDRGTGCRTIIPLLHLPCLCRKPEQGDICSVQSLLWCMSALVGQAYAVRLQHDEPLAVKLAYSPLESFLAHPEGGVDGGGIAAVVQTDMSALLPEVLQ